MIHTFSNILLIAVTEIKRMLVTRKGLISLAAFLLVWLLLLAVIIQRAPSLIANGSILGSVFESQAIRSLTQWSAPEFGAYWFIALYLFPLCCVAFAADQTASDRTRGTLKLLTLHTSRASIFLGRFTGLMMVQGILIMLTLISTLVVVALRDTTLLPQSISDMFYIWVNLMIVIAPYTGLMALISLFAKSGMQALNYAAILWILIWFAIYWLSSRFPEATALKSIFPGSQVSELVKYNNWSSLPTTVTPAVQTVVFLIAGLFLMRRIDL